MPNLIVERGREKGATFELKQGDPCVAGRDPEGVQIVLSDPAASRRHFQVAAKNGKWFVSDLGSRNHTYLNEEKLEKEVELSSGDRIQVGETVVSFLDEDKSDKSAAQGLNGKEIGGYKILDRLGRGGMGTVFKAKQISLNRVIALKVLASKFAKDPKFVEKFVSEARAAGQLNHPNVVQVFDVGQLGGLHFFSMELMEGGCVQDLLTAAPEGRLTWQEAMPLIVDAARGLVFAEKRGIIHRDIKPDNLMLTSEQRVKIGDLGLAKKADEGSGDKQIFGTPHFIAPEQALGKEVGHPADLYALGASFYRVVTGKTPFSGDSVKEILRKQINDPHQPVTQIVTDFPPDLAAIIDKLMAKKVENRYQSATKLVEDLEAFQLAHQIELSGARKMNKPLLIAAMVIGLAAAGVAIYYATRPPEVITKEGQTIIKTVKEPGGPGLTPEEIRDRIAIPAERAYYAIKDKDPRTISLDKEKELLDLAAEYEALATKHPDPAAAAAIKPGLDRAAEIRATLDRLKAEKAADESSAKKWWDDYETKRNEFEKSKNWAEVIRLSERWRRDQTAEKHFRTLKGAREELSTAEARTVELAEKDFDAMLRQIAEDLEKPERDLKGAMRRVREWGDALEKGNPTNEKLKSLLQLSRTWVENKLRDLEVELIRDLEQDKDRLVEAFRALRTGGSGGGPLFDYEFESAANQIAAAGGALRTYPCQDRAATRAARLRTAQAGWNAWLGLLADGKLFSAGDEFKGLPGGAPGVTHKLNLEDRPTSERVVMDTVISAGKGKRPLVWSDLTREELATLFVLPKIEKLPGDVALGLSWMFAELAHGNAAALLLDRAASAGANIAAADETALRREITAIKDYDALRAKAAADADKNEVVAAANAWRQSALGTDVFIDVDGRPGGEIPVFPPDKIDEFVKNLGDRPQ